MTAAKTRGQPEDNAQHGPGRTQMRGHPGAEADDEHAADADDDPARGEQQTEEPDLDEAPTLLLVVGGVGRFDERAHALRGTPERGEHGENQTEPELGVGGLGDRRQLLVDEPDEIPGQRVVELGDQLGDVFRISHQPVHVDHGDDGRHEREKNQNATPAARSMRLSRLICPPARRTTSRHPASRNSVGTSASRPRSIPTGPTPLGQGPDPRVSRNRRGRPG